MSTSGTIALVTFEDQRLLVSPDEEQGLPHEEQGSPDQEQGLPDQKHGSLDEEQGSPDEEQGLLDTVNDLESKHTILLVSPEDQGSLEEQGLLEKVYEVESKHTIFLSHSGAQKNFVEQLCEDLERAKMSAFFDKRPESLPKGEVFAPHIFQAADQCDLAVVVVSEEYFTRSKWPMLELCAFVQSSKSKVVLPLFFGLSFKEFRNLERRERWFETWHAWAEDDARIQEEDWKNALRELDRRLGLHYVEVLGEVDFRKDVVRAVYAITQKILQEKALQRWSIHEQSRRALISSLSWSKIILWIILIIITGVVVYVVYIISYTLVMSRIFNNLTKNQLDMVTEISKSFRESHDKNQLDMFTEMSKSFRESHETWPSHRNTRTQPLNMWRT